VGLSTIDKQFQIAAIPVPEDERELQIGTCSSTRELCTSSQAEEIHDDNGAT
jgi:hypothetical protein